MKPGVQVGSGTGATAVKNDLRPPKALVSAGTPQAAAVSGWALSIAAYIE